MTHNFKRFPELKDSQMPMYYFDSPHRQIKESFMARVIQVTDGDTIKVLWRERDFDFPIRLARIDAVELADKGERARDFLAERILDEEVYIIINPKNRVGKFGRLIGDVIHFGQSMSQVMLDLNYAVPFGK